MNLLWKELFDAALLDAPHQAQGIYLWENQSWERAWIHAWRKHGHGKLTGVAHSTIRFWDLRYFDSRTGCDPQDPFPIPQPDAVALNGKASIEALAGFGTSFEIQECEALRFQKCQDSSSSRNDRKTERDGVVRVLVLGDFLPAETKRMLDLLNAAAPEISSAFSFTLKPHPNHLPDLSEYKGIEMDVVTEHLSSLLPSFDVAYASNITSAAVDAYLAGLSVVVLYPDDDLNYSPLRNREGVHFVTSVSQFIEALKIPRPESRGPAARDMFRFDPEFPLWRKILEPGVQKVT
jgi:surface carbohydrate biosynthesis protein (TIGR04326 family)